MNLLHRLAISLATLGDWALRTQLDQHVCRFANDTAGEDE